GERLRGPLRPERARQGLLRLRDPGRGAGLLRRRGRPRPGPAPLGRRPRRDRVREPAVTRREAVAPTACRARSRPGSLWLPAAIALIVLVASTTTVGALPAPDGALPSSRDFSISYP